VGHQIADGAAHPFSFKTANSATFRPGQFGPAYIKPTPGGGNSFELRGLGTAANCLSKPGMGVDLYYSPASRDCKLPFQVPAKLVDFPLKLAIRDFSANGRVGAAQPIP
jgi:hypothetical protein